MCPMSRPMKDNEIQAFEEKYGYKPTAVPVAIDALAVFVHKDNPIKSLDIGQVDAIFSSTRLCGGEKDIKTWGDPGMTGEWAAKPIQLFGRNSVSGRSEEHTSELQSLMRISYAVFCLKKKN